MRKIAVNATAWMPTGIRVDRKAESEELFFSELVAPPEPAVEEDCKKGQYIAAH